MNNSIGQYVKLRRTAMKMSLREFGALCGMSHTHIDSIEKGYDPRTGREVNITAQTLSKLSQALGVSEAELVGGKEEKGLSDAQLKYALFGSAAVSDALLDEVRRFAELIKIREGL